ncbi:MAG: hypothetical protein P8J50_09720 [Acidimicrobiales bacterium]|nr:hypothetical protein [Acidimicrobiales bacterium]
MNEVCGWAWRRRTGAAADLHAWEPPEESIPTVDSMNVERAALALGSAQDDDVVDADSATRNGIEVVRRRSGGGAVLLVPDEHIWIDLWLPAGDCRWNDDVVVASAWVADVWIAAAREVGLENLRMHAGPQTGDDWAREVCFTGAGPGEVFSGDRKLVGLSQRRTRDWARFQCLVHRRWDSDATFGLMAAAAAEDAVPYRSTVASVGDLDLELAFLRALALS